MKENLVPMPGAERLSELKSGMAFYAVYSNGDFETEFPTIKEARAYIKSLVKGTAEHYGHTQKWAREHLNLTIERVEYN